MAVKKKFPALGRGLDAIISTGEVKTNGSSSINEVDIYQIKANPNQPRRDFDPEAMEELAESIRQIGIIQPITLRQMEDGTYQIIAGERRWRASQIAGLTSIPAYIRTADDEGMMQMALVENIQREDLNMTSRRTPSPKRWGRSAPPWPTTYACSNCRHKCKWPSKKA